MRWIKIHPKAGTQRERVLFLFFPKTLQLGETNVLETRWWEFATILEERVVTPACISADESAWWRQTCWV